MLTLYFLEYCIASAVISDLYSPNYLIMFLSYKGSFMKSLRDKNRHSTFSLSATMSPKKQKSTALTISASPKNMPCWILLKQYPSC